MTNDDVYQARPHDELIREILDPRIPKREREHAAAREIERLREDVAEWKARADELAAALNNCIKLAYSRDLDALPSAIITTATKAVAKYDMLVDFSAAIGD